MESLNSSNSKLLTELKDLKDKITAANAQALSMKEVAVRSNLRLGVFLCKTVNDGANTLGYSRNFLNVVKNSVNHLKNAAKNLNLLILILL